MAAKAGLADYIDFRVGDAVKMIAGLEIGVDFVLLDLWKDLYLPCFEAFYPKLNPGAIVVADNMRPNNEAILPYGRAVRATPGMASVLLPVGSGIELSRYEPAGSPYEPHAEAQRHAVFEGDGRPAAPDRVVADAVSPHQQKEQRRDV
jgi:hypothetical protein